MILTTEELGYLQSTDYASANVLLTEKLLTEAETKYPELPNYMQKQLAKTNAKLFVHGIKEKLKVCIKDLK